METILSVIGLAVAGYLLSLAAPRFMFWLLNPPPEKTAAQKRRQSARQVLRGRGASA